MKLTVFSLFALALAGVAQASDAVTTKVDLSFDDASFALENAIVDRGLNVEYVSHVGEMLERTGADVGSDVEIFKNAEIYIFCSAVESRKAMEADPLNIAYCPYNVFVFENEDGVFLGHRDYPDDASMDDVETMLEEIVAVAAEG